MERFKNSFLILITIITYFKIVDGIIIGTRIAKPNSIKPSQMNNSSLPKIMLKNNPNKSEVNLAANTIEIVFICESNIPNRWIWNAFPGEEDIEIKKTWTTSSFLSDLILKVSQNGIPDFNFSCTTTMGLKLSGKALVTCATIKPNVNDINETGLQSYSVKIIRNIPFENCTSPSSISEIKLPPNLTVDLSNEVKASCSLKNWKPASQYCLNLDICESKILSSGQNSLYLGTVGKITNSSGKKILKNLDYPHVVYCQQYRNPSIAPFMLIYPGYESTTWTKFTYYSTLKDAISSNSIQIIVKGEMSGKFHFAEKEEIQVVCRAIKFLYINGFRIGIGNETLELLSSTESEKNSKLYEAVTNITLNSKVYGSTNNTMTISCSCPIWNWESSLGAWGNSSVEVSIFPAKMPNATVTKKLHNDNDLVTVNCSYNGWPQPVINWTTSQPVEFINETGSVPENNLYRENGTWYQLKRFSMGELNTFTVICTVTNFIGNCSVSVKIDKGWLLFLSPHVLYPIIGGCAIIVFLAIGIVCQIRFWRLNRLYLSKPDINEFHKGSKNADSPDYIKIAYDKAAYEILKSNILLDENANLGSGAFGCVCKGIIKKGNEDGEFVDYEVAVKKTKPSGPLTALKGLLSEIKILTYLGKHPNVVELIGAYTEELKKRNVYVFLQLCSLGSLESYLRKSTHEMEDQFQDGLIKEAPERFCGSDLDPCLKQKLLRWSSEIANGLEFITSKNIVHADVASRNVLLTANETAKISDFGLSRRLYQYAMYVKEQQEPLPWKWMAPESLLRMEFTEKSDVWAFGVTLWEIYSLGDSPYAGLSWNLDFAKQLERGLNPGGPKYDQSGMQVVMLHCWKVQPKSRPTFTKVKELLNEIMLTEKQNVTHVELVAVEDNDDDDDADGEGPEYIDVEV